MESINSTTYDETFLGKLIETVHLGISISIEKDIEPEYRLAHSLTLAKQTLYCAEKMLLLENKLPKDYIPNFVEKYTV